MTYLTSWLDRRRLPRRADFIRNYAYPAELTRRLAAERPEWAPSQIRGTLEDLRRFFLACAAAQRRGNPALDVPSQAVDDAWHELILMTREYMAFCEGAFGRYLHHAPEGTMGRPRRNSGCGADGSAFIAGACAHASGGHGDCGGHGCGASCGGGGCGSG